MPQGRCLHLTHLLPLLTPVLQALNLTRIVWATRLRRSPGWRMRSSWPRMSTATWDSRLGKNSLLHHQRGQDIRLQVWAGQEEQVWLEISDFTVSVFIPEEEARAWQRSPRRATRRPSDRRARGGRGPRRGRVMPSCLGSCVCRWFELSTRKPPIPYFCAGFGGGRGIVKPCSCKKAPNSDILLIFRYPQIVLRNNTGSINVRKQF